METRKITDTVAEAQARIDAFEADMKAKREALSAHRRDGLKVLRNNLRIAEWEAKERK